MALPCGSRTPCFQRDKNLNAHSVSFRCKDLLEHPAENEIDIGQMVL